MYTGYNSDHRITKKSRLRKRGLQILTSHENGSVFHSVRFKIEAPVNDTQMVHIAIELISMRYKRSPSVACQYSSLLIACKITMASEKHAQFQLSYLSRKGSKRLSYNHGGMLCVSFSYTFFEKVQNIKIFNCPIRTRNFTKRHLMRSE